MLEGVVQPSTNASGTIAKHAAATNTAANCSAVFLESAQYITSLGELTMLYVLRIRR